VQERRLEVVELNEINCPQVSCFLPSLQNACFTSLWGL
jgi:hypothetical protein